MHDLNDLPVTTPSRNGQRRRAGIALCTLIATAMAACSGGGGGGSQAPASLPPASASMGTLRLALTDAPACGFEHVFVTIEKVRVHQSSTAQDTDAGWSDIALTPARRIDLLTLTNGAVADLGATALPAGQYAQMQLVLSSNAAGTAPANAVQPAGGAESALPAPAGPQTTVSLRGGSVAVAAGQTADVVLDFDACRSVVEAGGAGSYHLKPVVTALPRVAGAIEGKVAGALVSPSTTIAAQQDGATLRATRPDASGSFSIPFLQAGSYTLVITSEGRATGVVTDVPVGSGATAVGSGSNPITLAAASMGEINGSLTSSTDQADASAPVAGEFTDAEVRASQTLASGASIEVRSQQVDTVRGTYRLRLPGAVPVKAAYAASGALSFTPEPVAAGKYGLEVIVRGAASAVQ